jgi:hypothetical protein
VRTTSSLVTAWWSDVAVLVVSLALAISQFATNHLMSAFDSGVYFAAASQFVAGHLPYHDFVFVQPPGIVVLLWPWAIIGRLFSLPVGFVLARGFTAATVAAVAVLSSRLLQPYGRKAALVGGVAVALTPTSAFELTAIKLEPCCLVLCLVAAQWVIGAEGRDLRYAKSKVVAAGIAVGVAGAVKLWALLLFVALVACVWRLARPLVWRFVVATGVGFVLVAGPFFVLAPSQFVQQVILDQLLRGPNARGAVSTLTRLSEMTGLRSTALALNDVGLVVFYGSLALIVLVALYVGGRRTVTDHFFLWSSVVTLVALLASKEFYNYYAYFWSPLLVGLVVSSVVRIWRATSPWREVRAAVTRRRIVPWAGRLVMVTTIGVGIIFGFTSVHQLSLANAGTNQSTLISRYIPAGSCVIFDDAIQGVLSNRLVAHAPCPVVVDTGGVSMAFGGRHPLRSRHLVQLWRRDFLAADYVVLAGRTPLGIPWSSSLFAWFTQHFHVTHHGVSYVIYQRN